MTADLDLRINPPQDRQPARARPPTHIVRAKSPRLPFALETLRSQLLIAPVAGRQIPALDDDLAHLSVGPSVPVPINQQQLDALGLGSDAQHLARGVVFVVEDGHRGGPGFRGPQRVRERAVAWKMPAEAVEIGAQRRLRGEADEADPRDPFAAQRAREVAQHRGGGVEHRDAVGDEPFTQSNQALTGDWKGTQRGSVHQRHPGRQETMRTAHRREPRDPVVWTDSEAIGVPHHGGMNHVAVRLHNDLGPPGGARRADQESQLVRVRPRRVPGRGALLRRCGHDDRLKVLEPSRATVLEVRYVSQQHGRLHSGSYLCVPRRGIARVEHNHGEPGVQRRQGAGHHRRAMVQQQSSPGTQLIPAGVDPRQGRRVPIGQASQLPVAQ